MENKKVEPGDAEPGDALQKAIGLTFNQLREANIKRLPLFKNRRGEPAHSEADGSDWSLGEWCNAVTGELGEAANLIKKVKRGDLSLAEARPELSKEFADIVTYLDILAMRAEIDLGTATVEKFNEVSKRVECSVFLSLQSQPQDKEDEQTGITLKGIKAIAKAAYNTGYQMKMDDAAFEDWFKEYVEDQLPPFPDTIEKYNEIKNAEYWQNLWEAEHSEKLEAHKYINELKSQIS